MKSSVKHHRMGSYHRSVVLNFVGIGGLLSVMLRFYTDSGIVSLLGMCTFSSLFVIYSLWFWIGKVKSVVESEMVSDTSSFFTGFFVIWSHIRPESYWWLVVACVWAVGLLVAFFLKRDGMQAHRETNM